MTMQHMKARKQELSDHDKYVGALIEGKTITTDKKHIAFALKLGMSVFWISQWHANFMAEADLGQKWKDLAASPVILEDPEGVVRQHQNKTYEACGL